MSTLKLKMASFAADHQGCDFGLNTSDSVQAPLFFNMDTPVKANRLGYIWQVKTKQNDIQNEN